MPCGHPRLGGIALIFANSRDVLESAKALGWRQDDPRNVLNRYSLFAMVLKVALSRLPTRVNAAIAATAISAIQPR
jgi:hypothetical protein